MHVVGRKSQASEKQSVLNKYQREMRNLLNEKLKTETLKVSPPPSSNSLTDIKTEKGLVP